MSSFEEEITDLHLSLECGDNVVKSQTPPTPHKSVEALQITEYVTSDTLDLSRRQLKDVVDCILLNSMLKNLYLEGNQISTLPDTLFTNLPNLVWLDLRNNQITSLPAEIGLFRCLKTLLLEGNPIRELPPELGNVITLNALSLRHCPITCPPPEVVQRGVQCILQYLRSAMAERPVSVRNSLPDMPPVEKLQLSELVRSSLDLCGDEGDLQRFKELKQKMIQMDRAELGYGAQALPCSLSHLPRTTEGSNRSQKSLPITRRKKEINGGNVFPELPPFDMQYWKRSEERKLAAMKEFKEKQAILEQRRKDKELLWEWRTQARVMQERQVLEHKQERRERHRREETLKKIKSGWADSHLSLLREEAEAGTGLASEAPLCLQCTESVILQQSNTPSEAPPQLTPQTAPYAIDPLCSVADSEEVTTHNTPRLQKQSSFLSQKEHEEARATRDRELEQRIRSHVQMMQEKRRRPRGTVEEETKAAVHDMEETKKLQSELSERKQDRDYRFTAFTGDSFPSRCDK